MTELHPDWARLVEDFFTRLPPELEAELEELLEWNAVFLELKLNVDKVRARLDTERAERAATEARIQAIVERQRIATELEMEFKRLQQWLQEMERARRQIDRITARISAEMAARRQATAQRAAEDTALWEAFKLTLSEGAFYERDENEAVWLAYKRGEANPSLSHSEAAARRARQMAEEARLRREMRAIKARPKPDSDDNRAAWDEFTRGL